MLDKINSQIKEAMKSKQKERLEALRYLKSMLMENDTSKSPKDPMDVTISHHKKLQASMEQYPDGHEQKDKISNEIKIIEEFLPKQLTEDEVKAIILEIKSNLENPNMGAIMKELSPKIKGSFNGKIASQLVKEALA